MATKEPNDVRSDFDLSSLFQAPATAMAGLLGVADGARKAVSGIIDTIASLQRAAAALEQMSGRMNTLLDDIEGPIRALTPEFERAMSRVQRIADAFEGPIDRLLPGLENAVETFDRVALSQLPENVDQLRDQIVTIVEAFSEFPRRMAGLAQFVPGLERLAAFRPIASPQRSTSSPKVTTAVQPVVAKTRVPALNANPNPSKPRSSKTKSSTAKAVSASKAKSTKS